MKRFLITTAIIIAIVASQAEASQVTTAVTANRAQDADDVSNNTSTVTTAVTASQASWDNATNAFARNTHADLMQILIPQKNNQKFSVIWEQAANRQDKNLAIVYLADALKDSWDKKLLEEAKSFINNNRKSISRYAKELALEKIHKALMKR